MILALDDVGYITGNKTSGGELNPERRNKIIRESRFYWHRDPLGKQPVRLWSDYAIGTGITYKTEGEDEGSNSEIQKQLDRFWKYHKNRCLTNSQGQWELSTQLLVDGDIFFAIFTDGDVPVIRTIDPLQIADIITDPDDELTVLAFKREIVDPKGARKTLYYRNWSALPADLDKAKDPDTGRAITVEENVVVYQHSFEKFGKRGNGLLSCVIDWSRYHRAFMNARVSLTQALAKFAFKLTAKGSDKVVKAVAQRLGSKLANAPAGSIETNPPTTPGGTFVQNQGLDLEAMPRTTGGGDAKSDGDQLKLMVCAGTNVHQHYFGDPSTGNLATAEAMELPMLKSFTRYQESWKDCWRDIFSIVLEEEPDGDPAAITIHLPAMLKDDLGKLGIFLEGLHQVFPEIQVPEILEMCLVALGAPNVEDIMASIAAKAEMLAAAQADANAQADGNIVGAAGSNAGSLAASKSPLGNQLPQPSIKVSRFTVPPKGAKESTHDYNLRVLRGMMGQRQQAPIIIPMPMQEASSIPQPDVTEALNGFAETLKRMESMFESRQRVLEDESARERSSRINQVLHAEQEGVRALKSLAEAVQKDSAPLLDGAAIERIVDKSNGKVSKTGTISRDPNTGEMKFQMEEAPAE